MLTQPFSQTSLILLCLRYSNWGYVRNVNEDARLTETIFVGTTVSKRLKIYPEKCIGCLLCTYACSNNTVGYCGNFLSRVRINEDEESGKRKQLVCIQCDDHFCAKACPVEAINLSLELGIYVLDENECINCGECIDACPHDGISLGREIAMKCDLCGGSPKCAAVCVPGAFVWEGQDTEGGYNE